MPNLAELTDSYQPPDTTLPVDNSDLIANYSKTMGISPDEFLKKYEVSKEGIKLKPALPVIPADPTDFAPDTTPVGSTIDNIVNRLTGSNGVERYQLWPEKVVREALSVPHDVMTGAIPTTSIDPVTGTVQTSPQMIAGAQAMSALAGSGGIAGTGEDAGAALGAGPFLRPALKVGDKIYKAPIKDPANPLGFGAEHSDALPAHLADDFYQKAMNGEDINHYNFGFMNHKGQFLKREDALDYGIKEGLLDPQSAKYGTLTSTMLADSSKPGTAIESLAKSWNVKGHENENWYHGTTHDFDKFSLAKGNVENHLGQYPHFTNNAKDASANYAGHGPDLTSRIENRAEDLMQQIDGNGEIPYGTPEYEAAYEEAKTKAAKEIAGPHEGAVIPAKLKMNNPVDVTPKSKTWIDFAAKTDKDGNFVKDNPNTIKLLNSLKKQGEKYGFDGEKVFSEVSDKAELYDTVKASELYKALRESENLSYAEHPKNGKLVNGHVIANVFKDLGFDGIVMDAKAAFPNMKDIPEGTLHAVPLKKNTVQSKLTGKTLFADSSKEGAAIQANKQGFYSALEHNVNNISQSKMTGDQWLGTLANKPGVKPEELDWTGVKSFLEERGNQPVTKAELQEHLQNNKVELKEVNKGGEAQTNPKDYYNTHRTDRAPEWSQLNQRERAYWSNEADFNKTGNTKYHSYQLPGGEPNSYREMLLTLPDRSEAQMLREEAKRRGYPDQLSKWPDKEFAQQYRDKVINASDHGVYKSSHWDEPNILAHVRMNDRMMPDPEATKAYNDYEASLRAKYGGEKSPSGGANINTINKGTDEEFAKLKELGSKVNKKSLGILEAQSDWHQQGRKKGYQGSIPTDQEVKDFFKLKDEANPADFREEMMEHRDFKNRQVPDAPFKKTWHELVLKRMIREAAEKGYDNLHFPGSPETVANIEGWDNFTKKLVDGKERYFVGGMGKKQDVTPIVDRYLVDFPRFLNKIGKEHKVKVEQHNFNIREKGAAPSDFSQGVLSNMDLPQSLKDVALHKGFPLFSSSHAGLMFVPVDHDPFSKEKK